MRKLTIYNTREEWLAARTSYIGGSDAAAVVGQSPWMTNVELFEIKTGAKKKAYVTNEAIEYGNSAEPLLRELFKLNHPELAVEFSEHNMWTNDKFPYAHASLDGWYFREDGTQGVLEIKTGNLLSRGAWDKWKDQIPQNYFCQVLHYMAVTEAKEATLIALLKGMKEQYIREYVFRLEDVQEDINYLMDRENDFYVRIKSGMKPDLIMPDL